MKTISPMEIQPVVRIVNYFRVVPGAVWGWRTIPDLELILVVAGRFAYQTHGNATVMIGPGQVLCIPPAQSHVFKQADRSERAVISCIHTELLRRGNWAAGDYRLEPAIPLVTETHHDPVIHDLFKRCDEVFGGYGRYRMALVETIVREIWLRLAEHWRSSDDPQVSRRMGQMVGFLRDHLYEPISRRDLAEHFSMTPEHINALFKKELGITPTQLIHRERVYRAYQLIRNDGLSVKQAAEKVGFCDQFYFSKVFKRILGLSPSEV